MADFDVRAATIAASGTAMTAARIQSPTPAEPQVAEASPAPAVDLPTDFPADVPVFKDATVSQVQNLANNAHNVVFRTAAPVGDVYAFYEKQLTDRGWDVTQQVQRDAHAFISFRKGDLITNITIAEDPHTPGKQVIAIMYEQEQPLEFDEF